MVECTLLSMQKGTSRADRNDERRERKKKKKKRRHDEKGNHCTNKREMERNGFAKDPSSRVDGV